MSLCYDFQKWTMITLVSVAISLSVGLLMQYAYGQTLSSTPNFETKLEQRNETLEIYFQMGTIVDYCFDHASDPNPVQDLVDKGLVDASFNGTTCAHIKEVFDNTNDKLDKEFEQLNKDMERSQIK
jgi:hypothetical protein